VNLAIRGRLDHDRTFGSLFEREYPKVRSLVRRFGVRSEDAEDVTQDVFVTAYRRLPDLDAARPIRPWLFTIVHYTTMAYLRRTRRDAEVIADSPDQDEVPDMTMSAEERIDIEQTRRLLLRALDALDIELRSILLMYDVDDRAAKEVAESLSLPVGTAYTRLRRARHALRRTVRRLQRRRPPEIT
jgi:RNA polymerase sigma-70 factor (ECF subfamily)